MDSNPFADLIQQYQTKPEAPQVSPFSDLIQKYAAEKEANRTLTPDEQARLVQTDTPPRAPRHPPGFVPAPTAYQKGQEPYPGMPLDQAWASDPISQGLDTAWNNSDVQAGLLAVGMHPEALGGAREVVAGVKTLGQLSEKTPPLSTDTRMPRASVRSEDELLETGGARIEEAKQNPAKVEADLLRTPMQEFRENTKTIAIQNPVVKNIAKRLEKAYTPKKPGAMSRVTGVQPKERPPVTLTELHGHQQRLDDVIGGPGGRNSDGRLSEQGLAATKLEVDKMVDNHPESSSFKIGKHEYHVGKQSQELSDILERAQRRRTWVNGDEAGALNAEIAQFLNKKSNRYKFTRAQRIELEKIGGRDLQALLGMFGSKTLGGQAFGRGLETMFTGYPGALAVPGHFARVDRNAKTIELFKKFQEKIRAGGEVR